MGNDVRQDQEMNQYDYLSLTHGYLASLALVFIAAVSLVFYHDPWGVPIYGDIAWKAVIVFVMLVWFSGHAFEAYRCKQRASRERQLKEEFDIAV